MSVRGPLIRLNNGVDLPAVGFGVYRASPEETADATARKATRSPSSSLMDPRHGPPEIISLAGKVEEATSCPLYETLNAP